MSQATPVFNEMSMLQPQNNNNNNYNNNNECEESGVSSKAISPSSLLSIIEDPNETIPLRNTSNYPVTNLDEFSPFDIVNLSTTTLDQMVDNTDTITTDNFFANPFDDNTHITPNQLDSNDTSTSNMLLLNKSEGALSNDRSNTTDTKNNTNTLTNDLLTPTLNDLLSTRSESPRTLKQHKTQINMDLFNSGNLNSQREVSPGTNIKFGNMSPNRVVPNPGMNFSDSYLDKASNKIFNLEEPSTNLDDLFNDVTSNGKGTNNIDDDDNDEEEDEVDESNGEKNDIFLTNSLLDVDENYRRHSDVMLNNNNIVPTMTPTSRASISHQFDMWSGLQKTKNHNSSLYNRSNLSNKHKPNNKKSNTNDSSIIKPTPNRQADNSISNMLDDFNLNFTDPFDKNNDLSEPNTGSKENIFSPSSPKNERRYSVRKAAHRGSVPAVDVEILRRLSTSAGMTPSSNFSSSENNTNNGRTTSNTAISQGLLSSNGTPNEDMMNNIKSNNSSTDNFHNRVSPEYAGNRFIQNNNNKNVPLGQRMGFNDSYNIPNTNGSSSGTNNNDSKYNSSYVSLPQKTARSASVANISSNRMPSSYTLPMRTYSPPPPNLNTIPNNSYMGRLSPAGMTPQQQAQFQNQMLPPQQNQMNAGFNQFSMSQGPSPVTFGNVAPPPPQQQQQQPIVNLPIRPIPQQQQQQHTLQQPVMAIPNFGQPVNGPRIISASTTIVKPNGNIDMLRTDDKDKPYKCDHCGKAFKRAEHLKRHIRSIHNQERPFTCLQCNKKFSRNDNLQQHMKIHERNAVEKRKEKFMPLPPNPSFT